MTELIIIPASRVVSFLTMQRILNYADGLGCGQNRNVSSQYIDKYMYDDTSIAIAFIEIGFVDLPAVIIKNRYYR